MLFSLVLAVASKEVELWQTFDDFAPRLLQDEMDEDMMVGDDEQEQDGFEGEMDGEDQNEIGEEEEEAMNPLVVAAPVVLVGGALAAYFLMNGGKKDENQQNELTMDNVTFDGLKEGKTEAVAAAGLATALVAGTAMMMGGGGSGTVPAAGFLANNALLLGGGATGLGALGYPTYKYFTRASEKELETEVSTLNGKLTTATEKLTAAKTKFGDDQTNELKKLKEEVAKLTKPEDKETKEAKEVKIKELEKFETALETATKEKNDAEQKHKDAQTILERRKKGGWAGLW